MSERRRVKKNVRYQEYIAVGQVLNDADSQSKDNMDDKEAQTKVNEDDEEALAKDNVDNGAETPIKKRKMNWK